MATKQTKKKTAVKKPRVADSRRAKKTAPAKKIALPKKIAAPKKVSRGVPKTLKIKSAAKTLKPRDEVLAFEDLIRKVAEERVAERHIEESKFDMGISKNARSMPESEIPSEYNTDRVTLLTVDPSFVFAYWEVRQESLQKAMSSLGQSAKLTLRFYDISKTGDAQKGPHWDVEVFDRLGNWYLKLDHPGQRLCLDIGMKNERGSFWSIARSNSIKLPNQSLAKPSPLKWMVVSPEGEKVITQIEEYTDADLELLKKILGPYFYDLFMRGKFSSIAGSSMEAVFQNISSFRQPQ